MTGTTSENAATPIAGTRTRRISSVAYADDDRLSDANTASAVGFPRRWCSSASVCSGGPRSRRLRRYRRLSGTVSRDDGSPLEGVSGSAAIGPASVPMGKAAGSAFAVSRTRLATPDRLYGVQACRCAATDPSMTKT